MLTRNLIIIIKIFQFFRSAMKIASRALIAVVNCFLSRQWSLFSFPFAPRRFVYFLFFHFVRFYFLISEFYCASSAHIFIMFYVIFTFSLLWKLYFILCAYYIAVWIFIFFIMNIRKFQCRIFILTCLFECYIKILLEFLLLHYNIFCLYSCIFNRQSFFIFLYSFGLDKKFSYFLLHIYNTTILKQS